MSKSKGAVKIEQQEAMCRKLAEVHGLDVVEVYKDDGKSAYTGKIRSDWVRMLDDVQAGKLDVLLAQAEDRFTRQKLEKDVLLLACVAQGVIWLTVNDGWVDPATTEGEFFAGLRAGLAKMETRKNITRQEQAHEFRASKGLARKGGHRPIGWAEDKLTLDPVEAKELRWAIKEILDGKSVFGIVKHWNTSGFTTSTGRPWQLTTVRDVLARPRNAGLAVYRGKVVPEVVGEWKTICTPEKWREVCKILNSKKQPQASREPKHLLSNIIQCECGQTLRYARNGSHRLAYRCYASLLTPGAKGRHVAIDMAEADKRAIDAVVSGLLFSSGEDVPDPDAARLSELHGRLQEVAAARARLVDAVDAGVLTLAEVSVQKAVRIAEAVEIEKSITTITARNAQAAMLHEAKAGLWSGGSVSIEKAAEVKADLRERFEELNLEQQRALVRAFVDVVVHRGRGPKRVEVTHLIATTLNEDLDALV